MNGQENLIPYSERTKEEVRELARKGGIKSGETRRRKKNMRECAKLFMELAVNDEPSKEELSAIGITDENLTMAMLATKKMFDQIQKGNVQAYKALLEAVGDSTATSQIEDDALSEALENIAENLNAEDQ